MKARWFLAILIFALLISNTMSFKMGKYGDSAVIDFIFFSSLFAQIICAYVMLMISVDNEIKADILRDELNCKTKKLKNYESNENRHQL
jgi:hypothetical protein